MKSTSKELNLDSRSPAAVRGCPSSGVRSHNAGKVHAHEKSQRYAMLHLGLFSQVSPGVTESDLALASASNQFQVSFKDVRREHERVREVPTSHARPRPRGNYEV